MIALAKHVSLAMLLMGCLFSTSNLTAQQSLTGNVVDAENGETLIGANILLVSDFSGTQTDLDGQFNLSLKETKGTLIVSYIGYEDEEVVFESIAQSITIKLIPKAATIETVVVKGEKLTGQVFAVEKINKLDIYLNPAAQADALKAVQSNPAATNVDETANVSLRGSPASETGIFLNNVPMNDVVRLDQSNGVGQFSIFNTSTIESVSVFPSNPPLEFGNATSGVVALYTDDEFPDKINSLSAHAAGIGLNIIRKLGNKTSLSAFSNWTSHHVLTGVNPASLKDLKNFNTLDFGTYGVHHFNKDWQLKFFNYAISENYQYQVRFPSFEAVSQQYKRRNQAIINLIQQKENTRFEWNQGINFSKANYQIGNIDIHTQNFDYFSGLNYAWYPENGSVKVGVNTNIHKIGSSGLVPVFDNGFSEEFPTVPFESQEWVIIPEVFVYSKWTFKDNFSIGLGGRYHPSFDDLESYGSYQMNLAYTLKEDHHFIASLGEYHKFQLPNANSDRIQKLFSRQYSLDYQGKKGLFNWSAAVYQKNNTRDGVPNIARGVEGFTSFKSKGLEVGVSLASIQSTLENEEVRYPSSYDLSYFLRTSIQYQWNGMWTVSMIYWQRQGRYYLPVSQSLLDETTQNYYPIYVSQHEGKRLPDYHRMDVSISRIMDVGFGSAVVFVSANNLLDIKNIRDYNYNFDYSERFEEYLNRRVFFFGVVLNWE